MNRSKHFIIHLEVYPFDVIVSIGETDIELSRKLRQHGVHESEIDGSQYAPETGVSKYCLFTTGQSLIRIRSIPKKPKDYGSLQHEIFHCASAILWKMGMKLKIKTSDEAYAYLIGFITTNIYENLFNG